MDELIVVTAGQNERLNATLRFALCGVPHETVAARDALQKLAGRRVLFALAADEAGMDAETFHLIAALRRNPDAMEGAVAGVLLDGAGELYTKQTADQLVLAANLAGCLFPGRPLVEATGSLGNWHVQAKRRNVEPAEAYRLAARELVLRLAEFKAPRFAKPKLLMLHASDRATSNTLQIGSSVCEKLRGRFGVRELSLQNGTIYDCRGCSFTTCSHYAAQNSCFYGGSIVSEGYPALTECDALLLLCPNYNDSVSANIMAFINRLTSLIVFNPLHDKYLFAVVVSGYSGGDLVAQQALGALCLNKAFMLPPRFCLLQTANDPGDAMDSEGMGARIEAFAENIKKTVLVPPAGETAG
ncbi:MAG TPA: NAD(P)H-dependent oxidoreductase [Eubacteriales bacterium]|nr:NAD(P)H-dependent oxidoreductase [Eubacteriales bacterium]